METIGILTSGGDAPGMNANVCAVVRAAKLHGKRIFGIRNGYQGLIEDDMVEMESSSVSGIIGRGGTILGTARCEEYRKEEGREKAARVLRDRGIEGLIVCGGDGSFRGAHTLWKEQRVPVIGTPGTIDNDIAGTDYTIGFDTAVNTALGAIDKIRDTAESHSRIFVIEVMGRDAGFIALTVGTAGGAEAILIPEIEPDLDAVIRLLKKRNDHGKLFSLVVVAEGVTVDEYHGGGAVMYEIRKAGLDARLSIIGHQQRGGAPTALDREIATRLGAAAVEELIRGGSDKMAGYVSGKVEFSSLDHAWLYHKPIDMGLYNLVQNMPL
jgi:6-phosphofructokinase 1